MSYLMWQKSSYSGEASACVEVAAAPDGTLRLRESDEPGTVLTVTPDALAGLLAVVKAGGRARGAAVPGEC